MSTNLHEEDTALDRYSNCEWSTRQSELLSEKAIMGVGGAIQRCNKTLKRWISGSHPVPAHVLFKLSKTTGDWRLLQSYAREANMTLVSIGSHNLADTEGTVMEMTAHVAEFLKLCLKLFRHSSENPHSDRKRLRELADLLHMDIEGILYSLRIFDQKEEQKH